jgi:Uma2 family endonuclease
MATTATLTGAQFDALPYEEGRLWELLDGELIPMPSKTLEHQRIVGKLFLALTLHLEANLGQGEALADVEFALDENYRLRPDVFVLLPERAASINPNKIPIPGAPDIAIEVISPSERAFDSQQKVKAYLRYGTREVWQVYPKLKIVIIHRGANSSTLDCGEHVTTPLLPGFSRAVESFFA